MTGISDLDNFSFVREKSCVIIGPFSPIEGGIAQYNDLLAKKMTKAGWKVERINYYHYLWGQRLRKSKIGSETDNILSIFNPLSWIRVRNYITFLHPDVVIGKLWTPPFILMYLIIFPKYIKRVLIVDNVLPHEWMPFSRSLVRVARRHFDKFIFMSQFELNRWKAI